MTIDARTGIERKLCSSDILVRFGFPSSTYFEVCLVLFSFYQLLFYLKQNFFKNLVFCSSSSKRSFCLSAQDLLPNFKRNFRNDINKNFYNTQLDIGIRMSWKPGAHCTESAHWTTHQWRKRWMFSRSISPKPRWIC